MRLLIILFCLSLSARADVLVLIDGQYRHFSEQEALARVSETPFAQALGRPLPIRPRTYLEIIQHRDGNTTVDNAIERAELGR